MSSDPRDIPFREAFSELGKLRAYFKTPYLCLTATANKKTQTLISKTLMLLSPLLVKLAPENLNTTLSVKYVKDYDLDVHLKFLIEELRSKKVESKKTIIFCRSIDKCSDIFICLDMALRDCFVDEDIPYAMYHSKTPDRIKENIQK